MPTLDVSVIGASNDGYSFTGTFNNTDNFVNIGHTSGDVSVNAFARFQSVTIPQGAIIDVAYLTVIPFASNGAGVLSNLYFNDIDDAVAPTTVAEHVALTRTTAFVAIDGVQYVTPTATQTPSIITIIQEVVNRNGWSSGNDMLMLWDDDGSDNDISYVFFTVEGSGASIVLHVEYRHQTDPSEMIRSELSTNWNSVNTDSHTPLFLTSVDPEVLSSRNQDVIKVYESRPRTKRRADHRYDYATYIAAVTIQVDVGFSTANINVATHSSRVMQEVERIIQSGRSAPDTYWDLLETDTFTFQHQYRNFARNIMNVNCKRIVRQIPGS